MNDPFVLQNFAGFAEVIANVRLRADPGDIATDSFIEIDTGFVAGRASQRGVANEMANFARTKFAVNLRREIDLQNVGELFGDVRGNFDSLAGSWLLAAVEPLLTRVISIRPRGSRRTP